MLYVLKSVLCSEVEMSELKVVFLCRVFFVSKERSPLAVCSILPFSKKPLYR